MKKQLKAIGQLSGATIGMAGMSMMGSALGSSAPGQLAAGFGSMMPVTGQVMGAGMALDAVKALQPKKKRR